MGILIGLFVLILCILFPPLFFVVAWGAVIVLTIYGVVLVGSVLIGLVLSPFAIIYHNYKKWRGRNG